LKYILASETSATSKAARIKGSPCYMRAYTCGMVAEDLRSGCKSAFLIASQKINFT